MKFTRYLLGNFFRSLILVCIGAVLIFVVIDFVGNIRMWLTRGMEDTIEYYRCYLPYIFYLILPIAILIGVVASIGNMARHLELTAVMGSGRSGPAVLRPLLLVGVILSGGMFWMGEYVLPDANFRRLELAQPSGGRKQVSRVKEKSNFAFISSDKHTWHFQFYSATRKEARKVILLCFSKGRMSERWDSRTMSWVEKDSTHAKGYWQMHDGFRRVFQRDGSIRVEPFQKRSLQGVVPTRPEDLIFERQTGDEMNTTMIQERIAAQRRSGEETRVLETQWHFKYSGPFVALITLLIGASLSHRYSRAGGLSSKFGVGLFFSFAYYVTIKIGLQMGEAGVLAPWVGAWLGNIIFGMIAFILLVRSFRL